MNPGPALRVLKLDLGKSSFGEPNTAPEGRERRFNGELSRWSEVQTDLH